MDRLVETVGLSLVALVLSGFAPGIAKPVESAQSKACSAEATEQGLASDKRAAFQATCRKGSLTPKRPTKIVKTSSASKAVVAPSGSDRTARSTQCNAEAARRGLHDSAFQSFRKGCLASAAPVGAIEAGEHPTTPTAAKPKLESLTNTPPK